MCISFPRLGWFWLLLLQVSFLPIFLSLLLLGPLWNECLFIWYCPRDPLTYLLFKKFFSYFAVLLGYNPIPYLPDSWYGLLLIPSRYFFLFYFCYCILQCWLVFIFSIPLLKVLLSSSTLSSSLWFKIITLSDVLSFFNQTYY